MIKSETNIQNITLFKSDKFTVQQQFLLIDENNLNILSNKSTKYLFASIFSLHLQGIYNLSNITWKN